MRTIPRRSAASRASLHLNPGSEIVWTSSDTHAPNIHAVAYQICNLLSALRPFLEPPYERHANRTLVATANGLMTEFYGVETTSYPIMSLSRPVSIGGLNLGQPVVSLVYTDATYPRRPTDWRNPEAPSTIGHTVLRIADSTMVLDYDRTKQFVLPVAVTRPDGVSGYMLPGERGLPDELLAARLDTQLDILSCLADTVGLPRPE